MTASETERRSFFTIGHSNLAIEAFLELLKIHRIQAIADVRSSPYSQYNPQFNRETLKQVLKDSGIDYVFLGVELGARRSEEECYENGQAIYERIAKTSAFKTGFDRLLNGADKMRIALMCAEKDPLTCHRTILICRNLPQDDFRIQHILSDGTLESHVEAEDRLLKSLHLGTPDLFRSREDILIEAYQRQGKKIAYKRNSENQPPEE